MTGLPLAAALDCSATLPAGLGGGGADCHGGAADVHRNSLLLETGGPFSQLVRTFVALKPAIRSVGRSPYLSSPYICGDISFAYILYNIYIYI